MKYVLQHYRKAIQGAVGAGVLALAVAFLFPPSQWLVTQAEWQAVLGAVIGGAGLPVVGKANAPKRARNQRGASDLVIILAVVVFVFLVLLLAGAIHR